MLKLTLSCKDIRNGLLMYKYIQGKWSVFIPKQPMPGMWGHTDDSFRELAKMWDIKGFVKFEKLEGISNCWFGIPGGCLLYDRPTLSWYTPDPQAKQAKISLFGNPSPPNDSNGLPWIFWARKPLILETKRHDFRKNSKKHKLVFIGNIENSVQGRYRNTNWGEYIDDFHLTNGVKHKFTHEQYLDRISQSVFGLCLRGFGQKCHRETELMGVGTIPIITPECDVTSYANPLVEGVHYLRVNEPSDIPELIKKTTTEQIKTMRENCIEWWEKSCSLEGSFKTTLEQIFLVK